MASVEGLIAVCVCLHLCQCVCVCVHVCVLLKVNMEDCVDCLHLEERIRGCDYQEPVVTHTNLRS